MVAARNFVQELERVTEHWSPRVVGCVNDQYIKVAKLQGEFVWHQHDDEDELFHVIRGEMVIEFADHTVPLREGDFCVVPKGVRHRPVAKDECWIVLIETMTTRHTGNEVTPLTRSIAEQLG